MKFQLTAYTLPLLLSAGLASALGVVLWRNTDGPLLSPVGGVVLVQFSITLWAVGQVILLSAVPLNWKLFGFYLTDIGIAATAPSWLLFSLEYTGNQEWLTRGRLAAVIGLSFVGILASLTNTPQGAFELTLVNPEYTVSEGLATFTYETGPLRWAYGSVLYAVHGLGNYFAFRKFLASRNVYRKRVFVLLSADAVIVLCTILSTSGLSPVPYMTLGPLVYVFFMVVSLLILASYRTLSYIPLERFLSALGSRSKNLAPAARDVIVEEIDSGVIVLDHRNRIVDINPLGREIVGAVDDRVVGKAIGDVIPTEIFADGSPSFLTDDDAQGSYSGVWVETPEGDRRCFDVSITPLGAEEGDPAGRVVLVHDVTHRERRKQTLHERNDELNRQNDQLEDFAGIVSHDLRNPLTVARGKVELAKLEDDTSYLEKVDAAHDRMEAIIDDVLTMARQGRTVKETEQVSLETVARAAWEHVDAPKAMLVTTDDATFEADRERLLRAFENLFRNAVEHGAEDVTITVGTLENGFYVEDDGPGIPADDRESVLEQGYTTSAEGTGFGLSIVRTVVEAHGWDIAVTVGSDGGARFEITGLSVSPSTTADEAGLA